MKVKMFLFFLAALVVSASAQAGFWEKEQEFEQKIIDIWDNKKALSFSFGAAGGSMDSLSNGALSTAGDRYINIPFSRFSLYPGVGYYVDASGYLSVDAGLARFFGRDDRFYVRAGTPIVSVSVLGLRWVPRDYSVGAGIRLYKRFGVGYRYVRYNMVLESHMLTLFERF